MPVTQLLKKTWIISLCVWAVLNVFGLFIINGDKVFGLLKSTSIIKYFTQVYPNSSGVMFYLVFASFIFAIFQTIFISFYHFSKSIVLWHLATWISLLLILGYNFFFFGLYVYPFINNIFNYSTSYVLQITGIIVYSKNFYQIVISSLIFGSIQGLISGTALGIMQSYCIKNPQVSKRWMRATIFSFLIGNIIISVIYSLLSYFFILPTNAQQIRPAILGLIYSAFTIRILVKAGRTMWATQND